MAFTGKIRCVVCQQLFGVRYEIYNQRIKNFGSEEELIAKYKCQKCRKDGPKVQKASNDTTEKNITAPKAEAKSLLFEPYTRTQKTWEEICEGINYCFFPNRFLDNDKSCGECDIYSICKCPLKNIKVYKTRKPKNII